MNKLPTLSIVTITLNSAQTIQRTIDSVVDQDYPTVEYFVVDGGSTDGTVEILKRNQKNLSGFISEKDAGIADAFNKGISRTNGDLIGIINSDDWYEPHAFNSVADAYQNLEDERRKDTIIHGNLNVVCGDGSRQVKRPILKDCDGFHWAFYFDMPVNHPTCFIPSEIYQATGKFDPAFKIAMDFDFVIRARKSGARFRYIPQSIANFSTGGVSTSDTLKTLYEARAAQRKNSLARLLCDFSFAGKFTVNRLKVLQQYVFGNQN